LETITAFTIATAFALLNGAVLGFIHPALSDDLKPTASDWRIGTLLIAGGSLLLAANGVARIDFLVPTANGFLLLGCALYARSIRRYAGRSETWLLFLPAAIATALNAIFMLIWPSIAVRLLVVTIAICGYLVFIAGTLLRHRRIEPSISSRVMIVFCFVFTALLIARLAYYLVAAPNVQSITTTGNIVNALSPALILSLPVVGTTVLALLCFERMRAALHRVASTDALTELPNRRTIAERGNALFARAHAYPQSFSVAVIDIDRFKQINDRLGHDSGDDVLKRVATALKENARGEKLVGRQGGEEFVVLLEDADAADAHAAAERLRIAVATESYALDERDQTVTVSIGVATMNENDASFDDLLRRADRALYSAKDAGRNCVRSA
jgi:diguanylate cyclase (GGDEF)-like protein